MVFLIIPLIFAALGAFIAGSKNRNVIGWALICFLFPLVGLLILLFLSNKRHQFQSVQYRVDNVSTEGVKFISSESAAADYDRDKWAALQDVDAEIAAAAAAVRQYGSEAEAMFARKYLALSDKSYLGQLTEKSIEYGKVLAAKEAEEDEYERERLRNMKPMLPHAKTLDGKYTITKGRHVGKKFSTLEELQSFSNKQSGGS